MADVRKDVHEEIDRLPDRDLAGVKEFLASYPTPLDATCRNAPEADEPLTEEEELLVAEAEEWLSQNGGRGIPHEKVMRELGLE